MDKLRAIHYFLRVAETGSISAAARAFEVTPSSVSKVISGLEQIVGFALLHRSTRRLSLTVDGKVYLERCRQALQSLDDAETEAKRERGTPRGTVKVGLHPAFRIPFFSNIARLCETHPELTIVTKITNSPSILLDEGFDVLIRVGDLPDSNLVARPIGMLRLIVAAAPRYIAQHGLPKDPEELEHHRWALPARLDDASSSHWDFCKNNERRRITVSGCVIVRDGMGLPETVISGAAISCLYRIAFMQALESGSVQEILPGWVAPSHPAYAVFPSARAITARSEAVVQFVIELLKRSDAL
jgi:LysR family transcriptional regulator, regulator for bpeEF and oprC